MIYPDDYKCLTCKFRYYACPHREDNNVISCSHYLARQCSRQKVPSLALYRCLFGVCPVRLRRGVFT